MSERDGEVDPRLSGRDRHLDGGLCFEVGVGLRLRDDLDRVGPALQPRRRRRGDVAAGVDRDGPPGRGVRGQVIGIGEARLDVGLEGDRGVLVGGEGVGLTDTWSTLPALPFRLTVSVPSPLADDGDGAGVAVQRSLIAGVERLAADRETSGPRPQVDRAARGIDGDRPGEVRRRGRPLPESVAELVVIVYVPAGRVWPLSVSRAVVSVSETPPAMVAE